ncbi:MAG TPA: hypothetical protein VF910_04975 [Candidatus Bathyarchaeia archaeon]
MKSGLSSGQTRSLNVALLGAVMVTLGMVTSPVITSLNLAQGIGSESLVLGYADLALSLIVFGLCILFYGATTILTNRPTGKMSENPSSKSSIIANVFATRRYSRLFLLSALTYGIFYAVASGIIVFQPAWNFSEVYHVGIPSFAIATCCGPVGETPEAVVYVTQHLGIVLVPINLVLLFSISWLVGLNTSVATFALRFRTKNVELGWFGGIGAFIGLFTSCPTCAGVAIIAMLGGTGTISAAFFLGPLQTFLIGLSVPMLVATPIMVARSLRNLEGRTCDKP